MPRPQSDQKVDLALAIAQLRSHQLQALFQTLGWQKSDRAPLTINRLRCAAIAQTQGITAWQVILTSETQLTPALERSLYAEIIALDTLISASGKQVTKPPLVIVVDEKETRSLWKFSHRESALYVEGQPAEFWKFRLRKLSQYPHSLPSSSGTSAATETECEMILQLLERLRDGIQGMTHAADRDHYTALTFQRLIFIQGLQTKGWLDKDPWYLQNRFGRAIQRKKNSFFEDWLKPLYRSLALPEIERPLALSQTIGSVPFVERVFDAHALEERYSAIAISDSPFEDILGWLSEHSNSTALNPLASHKLGLWLSRYWERRSPQTSSEEASQIQTSELTKTIRTFSLEDFLKKKILETQSTPFAKQQFESANLNTLLFSVEASICRHLIQDVIPALRILDPACGSGLLLTDLNRRLVEVSAILTGYIQQTEDAQLRLWQLTPELAPELTPEIAPKLASEIAPRIDPEMTDLNSASIAENATFGAEEEQPNLMLTLQKRVMKNNLYGVDIVAGIAETARFQLLLSALEIAKHPDELTSLPDLSFNILAGNALIGFIQVDEERFDQVNRAGDRSVLQGNLLQPLAAEGYQSALTEKNLALEHYRSRNQVLAEARVIPGYARASLLREEVAQLDTKAQSKLNALLLNYMSQQLSIQHKTMQLADKPKKRQLTAEDIDILQPFHWGYHFSHAIEQGGFDLVVCMPPAGALKPTVKEFLHRFQDLAISQKIEAAAFKTSKQALSTADPDVAQAWMFYQDTYTYAADYFYRSEQYAYQNPTVKGKLLRNQLVKERLFVERCFSLLRPNGIGAIALQQKISDEQRVQTLWQHLKSASECSEHLMNSEDREGDSVVLSCHKRAST